VRGEEGVSGGAQELRGVVRGDEAEGHRAPVRRYGTGRWTPPMWASPLTVSQRRRSDEQGYCFWSSAESRALPTDRWPETQVA